MNRNVALCVDEQSFRDPALIGLEGESLEAQGWLEVYSDAGQARSGIRDSREVESVWVAASQDVEPINLAATIKADRPELRVSLITGERYGSLCSRARTAHIDEVIELESFIRLYAEAKHRSQGARGCGMPADGAVVLERRRPSHAKEVIEGTVLESSSARGIDRPSARKGMLMSVVSGSGGAGKSSVAVMAALCASRRGFRVLLLDLDLQFGDIAAMVGAEGALEADVALDQPDRLRRFVEQSGALSVLARPARLEASESLVQRIPELLDALSPHYDVIIANTGASWAEQHALLLERSSIALFLIDQRSSSLRACRHALELCSRCGIGSVPFRFALNRCAKNAPFASLEVSSILQGAEVFELKDGGFEVEECLSGGAAEELARSNNDFATSVGYMMEVLLPRDSEDAFDASPRESGGLFKRRSRHSSKRRGR